MNISAFQEKAVRKMIEGLEYAVFLKKPGAPGPMGTRPVDDTFKRATSDAEKYKLDKYALRLRRLEEIHQLDDPTVKQHLQEQYIEEFGVRGVRRYATNNGARIYRLPIESFPGHVTNIYLICDGDIFTLIDLGAGSAMGRDDIHNAFEVVQEFYAEKVQFPKIDHIVFTHGHIDHFGMVNYLKEISPAPVYIHEADAEILTKFESRFEQAAQKVGTFVRRSGVDSAVAEEIVDMYVSSKYAVSSTVVDHTFQDGEDIIQGYHIYHTPGHCPGQVCIRVHNALFTGDHILPDITPHQAPESLTPNMGLAHYLHSLEKVRDLEGVDLILGGHNHPIPDLRRRVNEMINFHHGRLYKVMDLCQEPLTLWDICERSFRSLEGYNRLLALEEMGAHIEFLIRRGQIEVANPDALQANPTASVKYRAPRLPSGDAEAIFAALPTS